MNEDQLMAMMAIVKKQHESVETMKQHVERLLNEQRIHESNLINQIESVTKKVVENQVIEAVKPLTVSVQQSINELEQVKWVHYAYVTGSSLIFATVLMSLFLWWLPSFDKIEQGKAEAKRYQLDYATCNGENCVRVMRNKCGFWKNGDYCVVDPK